jgi:hypothetical protein
VNLPRASVSILKVIDQAIVAGVRSHHVTDRTITRLCGTSRRPAWQRSHLVQPPGQLDVLKTGCEDAHRVTEFGEPAGFWGVERGGPDDSG